MYIHVHLLLLLAAKTHSTWKVARRRQPGRRTKRFPKRFSYCYSTTFCYTNIERRDNVRSKKKLTSFIVLICTFIFFSLVSDQEKYLIIKRQE